MVSISQAALIDTRNPAFIIFLLPSLWYMELLSLRRPILATAYGENLTKNKN